MQEGYEVSYKGGALESEGICGQSPGTEVVVRNLFYNTPARRKFLKTEQTELAQIVAGVLHMAIANPFVGFELKHNGKILVNASAAGEVELHIAERIRAAALLGKNFLEDALMVKFKTLSIDIHGFVGKPGMSMSSKRHQYLFVNGRDVTDSLVARAVIDAYGTRLPARNYPMFILHINLSPAEVDSNVHPRKLAVKFLETQRVYRDVNQAVAQALEEKVLGDQVLKLPDNRDMRPSEAVQEAMGFAQQLEETQGKRPEGISQMSERILGQIADSYILIFDEEGLAIVDQHAAHERIMYEKFKQAAEERDKNNIVKQQLLVPVTIECAKDEAIFLKDAVDYLEKIGFEFDKWSGNTFVLRACPAALKQENLQKVFRDFLDDVMQEKQKMAANYLMV